MIGLDTNVLLRLVLRDDEAQYQKVLSHVVSGAWSGGAVVNAVVLAEASWTLAKQMKRPKAEVIAFVERLLATSEIVMTNEAAVLRALVTYKIANCEYADCLIGELNAEAGAKTTISFDAKAAKLDKFSPIA